MQTPPYLNPGDKIAIVSPARSIAFEEVYPAMKCFQQWGFEIILGTHVFSRSGQFAGTDEQRCFDMQQMLDDPSIKAILSSRGGYGTVRIIDQLDFSAFLEHPKWIIGYSDITVLHCHINHQFGVETLHATMPVSIREDTSAETLESLRNALIGTRISYTLPRTGLARTGSAEGVLIGGNLSILYSLMGSDSFPETEGRILFLEDVDEYLYHIDRMIMALKRSGKLDRLKGLLVGGMDRMNDNAVPYGKTAYEIISEAVREYRYPVYFGFPSGHGLQNLALILGRKIRMNVDSRVEVGFLE